MKLRFLLGLILAIVSPAIAVAQELDDDFSRQELFSVVQSLSGEVPFSLPTKFAFPDDARSSSTFGVDFSHHNSDNCNCVFDWPKIAGQQIKFVYLKASQGSGYEDPTVVDNARAISASHALEMGVYHFLTAEGDGESQWKKFESVLKKLPAMQLPPSVDLEWDAGPWRDDCPSDAIISITKANGDVINRCDKWGFVTSADIIKKVNVWAQQARAATGMEPVLYTCTSWWKARIAKSFAESGIDIKIVWIADYTKKGLLSEKPAVPSGSIATLWQFTDRASFQTGHDSLSTDASIYDGSLADFKAAMGVH